MEEFIGLYQVPAIDSSTLTELLKDSLCWCNLPIVKLQGQCYDGANAMREARSGVATKILKRMTNPKEEILVIF